MVQAEQYDNDDDKENKITNPSCFWHFTHFQWIGLSLILTATAVLSLH